jgi:hypothetical protein
LKQGIALNRDAGQQRIVLQQAEERRLAVVWNLVFAQLSFLNWHCHGIEEGFQPIIQISAPLQNPTWVTIPQKQHVHAAKQFKLARHERDKVVAKVSKLRGQFWYRMLLVRSP